MRRIRVIYMDGLIETFAVERTVVNDDPEDPHDGAVLRLFRKGDSGAVKWFQSLPMANIRRWEKA